MGDFKTDSIEFSQGKNHVHCFAKQCTQDFNSVQNVPNYPVFIQQNGSENFSGRLFAQVENHHVSIILT
jgi:hypothetical protein